MADRLTSEQRHRNMSNIRSRNTKPETTLRKALFSRGFRYRINVRSLPGTPDIVLPKYRAVIFVNGCFWHGHNGCKYYVIPATNTEFWIKKIDNNIERDMKVTDTLQAQGWKVITVWECELRGPMLEATVGKIAGLIAGR